MFEEGVENMRVIIVDDRPFFMWETVEKLQNMGVDTIVMLYFQGPFTYRPEKDAAIREKCGELGIQLVCTDKRTELMNLLDQYYEDQDTLLFIDFNLGDTDIFEERIDIIYAKEKKRQAGDFRIWFYTVTGIDTVNRLNRIFDGHTIPAVQFAPQEYILRLDYTYIQDNILNGNL